MIVRARAGREVRVPAAAGTLAELRVQGRQLPLEVASGETSAVWGASATAGLHWGRRSAIYGEVWIGKVRHGLEIRR